jgi:hypothetical protein
VDPSNGKEFFMHAATKKVATTRDEIFKTPPKYDNDRKPEAAPSMVTSSSVVTWRKMDKFSMGASAKKPILLEESSDESETRSEKSVVRMPESSLVYGPQTALTLNQNSDTDDSGSSSDSSATQFG